MYSPSTRKAYRESSQTSQNSGTRTPDSRSRYSQTVGTPEYKTVGVTHTSLGLLTPESLHINPITTPTAYQRFVNSIRHNDLYSISYKDEPLNYRFESIGVTRSRSTLTDNSEQEHNLHEEQEADRELLGIFDSSEDEISTIAETPITILHTLAATHQQLVKELNRLNKIIAELIELQHDAIEIKSHAFHRVHLSSLFIKSLIVTTCFLTPTVVFWVDYFKTGYR